MVLVNYSWYRDACKVWWYVCLLFPHAGWSIFVFRWNWICFPTKLDLLWCMLSHVIDGTRYVKVPWYIVTQLTRLVAVVSISLEWFLLETCFTCFTWLFSFKLKMDGQPDFGPGCSGFFRWLLWRIGRIFSRCGARAEAAADPGTSLRRMLEEVRSEGTPTLMGDLIGRMVYLFFSSLSLTNLFLFWCSLTSP